MRDELERARADAQRKAGDSAKPGVKSVEPTRRRGFFALVGAAGVAGTAALAASQTAAVQSLTASSGESSEGYRLTEHIRKYYRTTMV